MGQGHHQQDRAVAALLARARSGAPEGACQAIVEPTARVRLEILLARRRLGEEGALDALLAALPGAGEDASFVLISALRDLAERAPEALSPEEIARLRAPLSQLKQPGLVHDRDDLLAAREEILGTPQKHVITLNY